MGGNTLTVLEDSTVLVAGGYDSSGQSLSGAEIYNSSTGAFSATGSLNSPRSLHTATLLNDGTVLIVGGFANGSALASAEIYLPTANTFLTVGNLNTARSGHTATLLPSGQVLIAGGADSSGNSLASAEFYDPTTGTFTVTGNLTIARQGQTATLLDNGMVLIAGGLDSSGNTLQTAELYNPSTGVFSATGNLTAPRAVFTATLLNNGLVLIAGGQGSSQNSQASAELYNPTTGAFTATGSMNSPRSFFTATLLNNGTVLVAGGLDASGNVLGSAELYDPVAANFVLTSNFVTPRYTDTAALLANGNILEVGGLDGNFNRLASAELYQPSTLTPQGLVSISVSPSAPSLTVTSTQPFVATGTFTDNSTQTLASATWSSSNAGVATISSDVTNHGTANALTFGSVSISACTGSICGSSALNVPVPSLISITLTPSSLSMPLGATQQFSAAGKYSDGSVQDVTSTVAWTSSSGSATVNTTGLVTAVLLGTSSIQASSGAITASANVTVSAPALVSLTVNPNTSTFPVGGTQQFQVVGTYTDGSTSNVTSSTTWFVVPLQTASVNSSGVATGLAQGNATITAVSGTLFATASITVQAKAAATLVAIAVTPNQTSIPIGSSQQFVATGNYSDGTTQDLTSTVTWASSSTGVATVNTFGLATAVGQGNSTITATSGSLSGNVTIAVTTGTVALNTSRYQHSATLLDNGSILVAGGVNCPSAGSCTYLNTAELYNPSSGTFTYTGSLATARSAPAILLGNGKVLVAGGYSCDTSGNCASLSSTEIFDPSAGSFSSVGNMTTDRYGHTLTLLANGKVLIAGGESCSSSTSCTALKSAELYDPVAGSFTVTGPMNGARFNASAASLSSGKVLILGGSDGSTNPAVAELYDPTAGTFSTTGSLNTPRAYATASWLEGTDDMILIVGGSTCNSPGCPTASTEYYQNGYFYFLGDMTVKRSNQTATVLTNGQVFLAGGLDSCTSTCVSDSTSELFSSQTFGFATSQALSTGRSGHTATLLMDGSVLLVGGINNGVTLASTDSYQPSNLALPQLSTITITPSNSPMTAGSTLQLVANGIGLGVLQPVLWTSSAPSVATVSNATGSAGIVNALSPGTTTITASVGMVSATAQITVTKALVSITVTPANPNIALNSNQLLQLTATGNYSDGTSSNLTPYVTWANSNTSVVTLMPNLAGPASQVTLIPTAVGTANFTAYFSGVSGSTSVSVVTPLVVVAPNVVGVSPTVGSAGTQVTITGSGFGNSQGSGGVWLGTTLAGVVAWSDSQVIATVSTGSTTGAAQIQQAGVISNAVPFAVNTATVSSVSPTSGTTGTQVTIAGSGFGAVQGSGLVRLGNSTAIVVSWSDSQIVASVAPNAASGTAQVLQGGVWSNSVPFTINLPHIANISPNSGTTGTVVTINGNGFGASRGGGTAWIGGTAAQVSSWSDAQVVATVPSSAMTGVVKIQQSAVWSNPAGFRNSGGGGGTSAVSLAPNIVNMVVGGTQPIQALNSTNQSVTGLTWASSNTSVATLSTDDPPTITAIGVGIATIAAGNASADVTVLPNSSSGQTLPVGTVICSNPGDASGVISIIPAVPSPTGVADVFALQADGTISAITSDCLTAWTANVGAGSSLVPDFQGGLVVSNGQSIYKLDGITGQAYPSYTSPSGNGLLTPVVHTDGTIFTIDGDLVVGINPQTGSRRVSAQMQDSTISEEDIALDRSGTDACFSSPIPPQGGSGSPMGSLPNTGGLMIAGDGYVYLGYTFTTTNIVNETNIPAPGTQLCTSSGTTVTTEFLRLLRLGTAGDSYELPLGGWSSVSYTPPAGTPVEGQPLPEIFWNTPITNTDTGVLFTWSVDTGVSNPCPGGTLFAIGCTFGNPMNLTTTFGAGIASQATLNFQVQPILQRADGSYIGTDGTNMFAFTTSGTLLWAVPNDNPVIATSNGGVIASSGITYNQSGNADGYMAVAPNPYANQMSTGWWPNWSGMSYAAGGLGVELTYLFPNLAAGYAPVVGTNPSGTATSVLNVGTIESIPSFALPTNGSSCELGVKKIPLEAGNTQDRYMLAKSSASVVVENPTVFKQCANFLYAKLGSKFDIIPELAAALGYQEAYDGLQSNLSEYAAGFWNTSTPQDQVENMKKYPVCSGWTTNTRLTVAKAQMRFPGTDIYLYTGTRKVLGKNPLQLLTSATVLHETLHNVTGLDDDQLYNALTGLQLNGTASAAINDVLVQNGCAANP
jgi:hypothetical protein